MTAPAGGGGGGSVWTRRYGPLPGWAWAGLGLGGALAYSVWSRNKAASKAAATDTSAAGGLGDVPGAGDQEAPWVFVVNGASGPTAAPTPTAAPPATGRPAAPGTDPWRVIRRKVGDPKKVYPFDAYLKTLMPPVNAPALARAKADTINDPRNAKWKKDLVANHVPGNATLWFHIYGNKPGI